MKKTIKSANNMHGISGDKKKHAMPAKAEKKEKSDDSLLANEFKNMSKAMLMMLHTVQKQMESIQSKKEKHILEWDFNIIRDEKGFIKKIKAKAING